MAHLARAARPAVYGLPAPDARKAVIVSTGALHLLSDEELAAVVAHERGHLRHHDHLVTALAGALHLAFPRVPLLRHARHEVEILAEMAADDHARRDSPPERVPLRDQTQAQVRERRGALDTGAERTAKQNVDRVLEDRTAFVIAGRLLTIRAQQLET